MTEGVVLVAAVFIVALLLTWLLRVYALRRSLLDIPNERSSHVAATPRGGGLAVVIAVLAATVLLHFRQTLPSGLTAALCGGGLAVAMVGWVDDHRSLGVAVRVWLQILAATWAVMVLGGIADLSIGAGQMHLGPAAGSVLAVCGIVWLVNLYNFLDGTDGYAGTQAVCAALAGFVVFRIAGQSSVAMLCIVVAAASAGFLIWNWSPAKIFMGDVGSYFLGYVFGVLALYGEKTGSAPVQLWLILLGVFVWDASLTLMRRLLVGDRWYQAHRTHAYQRLHQLGLSHRRIATLLIAVNVLFLWPLAYWACIRSDYGLIALFLSVLVLSAFWSAIQARFVRHR